MFRPFKSHKRTNASANTAPHHHSLQRIGHKPQRGEIVQPRATPGVTEPKTKIICALRASTSDGGISYLQRSLTERAAATQLKVRQRCHLIPSPKHYARGLDLLWGVYQWLDRAPEGRNEKGFWWHRRDEYESRGKMAAALDWFGKKSKQQKASLQSTAIERNAIVVTGEILTGNLLKPRIPDVCQAKSIRCINFLEMIRELKLTF